MMDDLKRFCGTDELQSYLMEPFSFGEHTFATDGIIMVRVRRRNDVAEIAKTGKWNGPLEGFDAATFSAISVTLPPVPEAIDPCLACDGEGNAHDCPSCECKCKKCAGTGTEIPERRITTTIRGNIYALRYVRMMLALPDVIVADKTLNERPLMFKFDGGEGALMPCRGQMQEHVDIETASG